MADTLRATIGTAKLRQHFNSADVIEAIMRGQRSPERVPDLPKLRGG
jgi:hypothetical protein